jgi:ribosomal protein L16 Arg81 hydroxylase
MMKSCPGGLTAATFLRRYWQKLPLLVRRALPDCADLVRRESLFDLAAREDLESRLVLRGGGRWRVRHGPFNARDLTRLPRSGWTLLVQGVERALPGMQELSGRFAFIPYARFDDVMASYAPDGGGVGPHFDSYDVFLLQGEGARRWRISRQRDLSLVNDAPLRILRRFRPSKEWLLGPGDMLYLPPRCAHDGVAVGPCITYSIGFRAPHAQELGTRFLEFLQDRIRLDGIYSDPGLKPQRRPARLPDGMLQKARRTLGRTPCAFSAAISPSPGTRWCSSARAALSRKPRSARRRLAAVRASRRRRECCSGAASYSSTVRRIRPAHRRRDCCRGSPTGARSRRCAASTARQPGCFTSGIVPATSSWVMGDE